MNTKIQGKLYTQKIYWYFIFLFLILIFLFLPLLPSFHPNFNIFSLYPLLLCVVPLVTRGRALTEKHPLEITITDQEMLLFNSSDKTQITIKKNEVKSMALIRLSPMRGMKNSLFLDIAPYRIQITTEKKNYVVLVRKWFRVQEFEKQLETLGWMPIFNFSIIQKRLHDDRSLDKITFILYAAFFLFILFIFIYIILVKQGLI